MADQVRITGGKNTRKDKREYVGEQMVGTYGDKTQWILPGRTDTNRYGKSRGTEISLGHIVNRF